MGSNTGKRIASLECEGIETLPDGRLCVVVPVNNIVEAAAGLDAFAQVLGWQLPPEWEKACEPVRKLLLARQNRPRILAEAA